MPSANLTDAEVVRIGRKLYDERIRTAVEPAEDGRFIVIDIETGEYEVADAAILGIDRLRARRPDALVYIHRAGQAAAYRLGAGGRAPA